MSVHDTIARIREFAAAHKLRPATLAQMAGLHPNSLRDMNEPGWRPRFDTLEKLEALVTQPAIASKAGHATANPQKAG